MRPAVVAATLWAASMILTVASVALLAITFDAPTGEAWGFRDFAALFAVAYSSVGAVLVWRRPAHPIGWLLAVGGLLAAVQAFAEQYAVLVLIARPGSGPAGVYVAWLGSWIWVVGAGMMGGVFLLLLPDGRVPSARWRWTVPYGVGAISLAAAAFAIQPGPLQNFTYVDNPFGVALPGSLDAVLMYAGLVAVLVLMVLGAVAIVQRARHAEAVVRQQLKWFVFPAILLVPALFLSLPAFTASSSKPAQVVAIFAFVLVGVAAGVAIFRYRLYEVDVLIRRTLVYGALVAALGATYVAAIVALQFVLAQFTSGSSVAVAASTLAVVALFQPLRSRIQRAVDQRFYRSQYDAQRTVDAFALRLRDEIDLDALSAALVGVVTDAVRPLHATLWLRRER